MANVNKRTPDITTTIADDNSHLEIHFRHGPTIVVSARDLNASVTAQALMHGLKQKIVDAAAISRDPETGRSATIEDKFRAAKEVADRLLSGEWNKTRAGGGNTGGLLLQALIQLYPGKEREELEDFVAGKTKSEQAALRANPKIAPVIAEIQAKRGAVDSDGLLGELED